MTPNSIVNSLLWIEKWGLLLHAKEPVPRILAWAAVVLVTLILIAFYTVLNSKTEWAVFVIFLIMDAGVSVLAMVILLLQPLSIALSVYHKNHNQLEGEAASTVDPLLPQAQNDHDSSDENQEWGSSGAPLFLRKNDGPIWAYTVVFPMCIALSVLSDCAATFHDMESLSLFGKLIFFFADFMEDCLYVGGFWVLAVSYRILALRVWHWNSVLQDHRLHLQANSGGTSLALLLPRMRYEYEHTFEASELLSRRTGGLTLLMVIFVLLEMTNTLAESFEEHAQWEWDLEHLAFMRLLLVLASLLISLALAAADVMYASERLAESMAQLEAWYREMHHTGKNPLASPAEIDNMVSSYGSTSVPKMNNLAVADLLKTLGYRVKNFPVRISIYWFHLTPEWAMGLSVLVTTLVLTVVGIRLPSVE